MMNDRIGDNPPSPVPDDEHPQPPEGNGDTLGILHLLHQVLQTENPASEATVDGLPLDQFADTLHNQTGAMIINLGRRAEYESEVPVPATSEFSDVVDYRERFNMPNHEFEPGTRVAVAAFYRVDSDGKPYLEADIPDRRMADHFYLPPETPDDILQLLNNHKGIAVGCIMSIEQPRREQHQISDIHPYDVTLEPYIVIPPINPTPEQIEQLAPGSRVALSGEVVTVDTKQVQDRLGFTDQRAFITIRTPDGRQITTDTWVEKLTYEQGAIENLRRKPVEPGDVITLTTYVTEDGDNNKTLNARYTYPFLTQPSPGRLSSYEALRGEVEATLSEYSNAINAHDYRLAREIFARIRGQELTQAETDVLFAGRVAMPQEEQPVFDGHEQRWDGITEMNEAYGISAETMTRGEFIAFAREAATRRRMPQSDSEDGGINHHLGNIFGILLDNYPPEEVIPVLQEAIDAHMQLLESAPEDDFDIQHSMMNALNWMSELDSSDATAQLIGNIQTFIDRRWFGKECPYKSHILFSTAVRGVEYAIHKYPDNILGIHDVGQLQRWFETIVEDEREQDTAAELNGILELLQFPRV